MVSMDRAATVLDDRVGGQWGSGDLGPRVPVARIEAHPVARTRHNPAWMLWVLLVGFPVFWALGLAQFAVSVMAVPMGLVLMARRPLALPRGFVLWALFLTWSVVGVLLLGVNPPGYVADGAGSRLLGFGMREISYVGVTVVLLFIGNLTEAELPQTRVVRMLGWFFVTTCVGGVLGLLAPQFQFTSPFEMVLPSSISSNFFVQNLIHPRSAQVQELISDQTPRPAAPFTYTNAWGFNLTLLGVWFVASMRQLRTVRAHVAAVGVLAVGVVVLVYSLNRAAWLGVGVAVLVVAVQLARRGRLAVGAALVVLMTLGLGAVAVTPLGTVVSQRLDAGKSDTIRGFTTEKALELSAESPVVGFGSTRATLGSAASIAVGKSPSCPQCGNANIGMNGYLFMLLVTTGYLGALLFFGFGAVVWWRSRRIHTPVVLAGTTVLAMTAYYSLFYDVSTGMLVPAVTVALLWRESRSGASAPPAEPPTTAAQIRTAPPVHPSGGPPPSPRRVGAAGAAPLLQAVPERATS